MNRRSEGTTIVLDSEFQWRDQRGQFHDLSGMETRHIVFSLAVLYNRYHPQCPIPGHVPYTEFNNYYTPSYCSQAVRAMYAEARTRSPMPPPLRRRLDIMASWVDEVLARGLPAED